MKLEQIINSRNEYFKGLAFLEARLEKLDNAAAKAIFDHFCISVFAIRFYNNHITCGGAFSLRDLDDHINRYFYYTNKVREMEISKDGERLHVYRQDCSGEQRDYVVHVDYGIGKFSGFKKIEVKKTSSFKKKKKIYAIGPVMGNLNSIYAHFLMRVLNVKLILINLEKVNKS